MHELSLMNDKKVQQKETENDNLLPPRNYTAPS